MSLNEEKKKLLLDAMQRLDELETQLQVMEGKNSPFEASNFKNDVIPQEGKKSSLKSELDASKDVFNLYDMLISELLVEVEQSEDEKKIALLVKCVEQLNEQIEKLRNVL